MEYFGSIFDNPPSELNNCNKFPAKTCLSVQY